MAKRPLGLSKAVKNKKSKKEIQIDTNEETEPTKITIELDQDVDPDDPLGQLKALYDTYVNTKMEIINMDADDLEDFDKLDTCRKLLSGIIHECDHHVRCAQETNKIDAELFTGEFYNIYALALLGMAAFTNPESAVESDTPLAFIEAAIERATIGLESFSEAWQLYFTRAKAYTELFNEKLKVCHDIESKSATAIKCLSRLDDAIADYERAEELIFAQKEEKKYTDDQLDTIEALLQIGEALNVLGEGDETGQLEGKLPKYLDWSKERWLQILGKVPESKGKAKITEDVDASVRITRRANRGMGEYYLAIASPLLARFEEDSEEEDPENVPLTREELAQTKEYVAKAIEYLRRAESETDGNIHAMIAEAQISLANFYEIESDEQRLLYNEAIMRLKRAQRLGYGNYKELIRELEEGQ